ncbi:bifunctional DNA-binding transcriptional regulator/O6-methylguanine-DNA methyltransferase Ada [Xenorhabdus sp. 12]|uniref:Bifunctional DNA-binding transcriptional regulator/O6-methylguanine-DNA methyltransferase Ada n=1 Tax=Xenorhabdus santafensis TaxID=2582833 RepID=A0ABU4S6Q9_9GAMM|nr:bifunctional DNA-binding transcriptional regulator/O6-methylguanine-DNA methyltransferase Ada [Xenorhabdus sp. 12]MDX7986198.1 bifunctional DNA-binding transcriptional regulator/O6-methylguanine-DNA methyltransferase Ada [Xenorhabdus sp. 12]
MSGKNLWTTDDKRWQAVVERDKEADNHFVYAVRTTGIYCQPSSTARLPKRENVVFFDNENDAEQQGYRPSKRLSNNQPEQAAGYLAKIAQACRYIEQNDNATLEKIARHVGMSAFHFHRLFKSQTGLTPKAYANAYRAQRLRDNLEQNNSVTEAILDAGFNSSSRFYEISSDLLGMTPKVWRAGGRGMQIYFALGICSLGHILVAQSQKGICAILLGDDPDKLLQDLQDKFPQSEFIGGDPQFEQLIAHVVGFIETPGIALTLPLDIRGTAFQQRVWLALQEIPVGKTVTYTEIAKRIGSPKSVRAVANACAANMLAVAIPCHRVVRHDGNLSGYRWGVERKRELLAREAKTR